MNDCIKEIGVAESVNGLEILFLALSLATLGVFAVLWYKERYAKTQKDHTVFRIWKFVLLLISGAFLALGGTHIREITSVLSGIQYVPESVYDSLKFFFAAGEIRTWDIANVWLKGLYIVLYYGVCALAVFFTATTVLSFFHNRSEMRRLKQIGNRRDLYVFNELNEKALSVAKSVAGSATQTKEIAFVFCNATEDDFTFMEEVKKLPLSFCLKNDVTEVHQLVQKGRLCKKKADIVHHYFLLKEDQPENVRQAIVIADAQQRARPQSPALKMFVFAQGVANGRILDGLHNTLSDWDDACMVRRISPAWLLAKNVVTYSGDGQVERLLVKKGDQADKDLSVLVVGMGQYGLEIAKTLTWFYQRKKGGITVHLIDRATGIYDRLSVSHTDWVDYDYNGSSDDDSCFTIVMHEDMDVYSSKFEQFLREELPLPDAVYVTLGDDDLNIEAAYYIRSLLDRIHYEDVVQSYRERQSANETLTTDKAYVVFTESDTLVQNDEEERFAQEPQGSVWDHLCNRFRMNRIIENCADNENLSDSSESKSSVDNDRVKIFSVVHDDKRCENLQKVDKSGSVYERYHIRFVGRNSEVFCYDTIFNQTDETEAQGDHSKARKNSYQEYYHLSSLSRVYHKRFMKYLYEEYDEKNREDETGAQVRMRIANKRWNTYMRTLGYRCINKAMTCKEREWLFDNEKGSLERVSHRGRWHNSVVPFSHKGPHEQANNLSDEQPKKV